MPYKSLYKQNFTSNTAFATGGICPQMEAMGWTLVDDVPASSYRVYKSNGESGDRLWTYLKVDWATANNIKVNAYAHWNPIAHTGWGSSGAAITITTSTNCYAYIYGDKDIVVAISRVSTTYTAMFAGALPKVFHTTEADVISFTGNGSNVNIEISDSTNFRKGYSYQLHGNSGEGREWVSVSAVPDSTHVTITSITGTASGGYLAGSKIGSFPHRGFHNVGANIYLVSPKTAVGVTSIAYSCEQPSNMLPVTSVDPDGIVNAYGLLPLLFVDTVDGAYGYIDSNMLNTPSSGLSAEDTFSVGEHDTIAVGQTGTATGTQTGTTLQDTSKSWTVNTYQNKFVIITGGLAGAVGQIRKIASNTADTLTVAQWSVTIDNTSTYVICDEAYRYFASLSTLNYVAFREIGE